MADIICTTAAQFQTAISSTANPGDVVLLRGTGGTYITTNAGTPSNQRNDGGFNFQRSGTAGNPITVRTYPGDPMAKLANQTIGSTTYVNFPTVTTGGCDYIVLDGVYVWGSVFVFDSGSLTGDTMTGGSIGNQVLNCEIEKGWESEGDGNWPGIYCAWQQQLVIRNNYIHDIEGYSTTPSAGMSSATGIKLYTCPGSLCEYNTVKTVGVTTAAGMTSQAGGIDDKQDSINSTHRYNWIENVNTPLRIQNQSSTGSANPAHGTQFYGNVLIGRTNNGRTAIKVEAGPLSDCAFFNNVSYGSEQFIYVQPRPPAEGGSVTFGVKHWNNAVLNISSVDTDHANIVSYDPALTDVTRENYNAYLTGHGFRAAGSVYSTLAAYKTAVPARNVNSDQLANTAAYGFVSAPTDFHLAVGSVLRTTGYTNGTGSGGAVCDRGAYHDRTAVGHGAIPPTGLVAV